MAHFAELDENNIVVKVTVVDNNIETSSGKLGINNKHVDGETWCKNFFNQPDTTFKQTSYNNNFRKQYAGKGYTYDAAKDKFISPQPHASWSLDGNDDWQAPIARPDDDGIRIYLWDETLYQSDNSQGWVEVT
tara:strand:- start:512 stop:910 length:399 start_codon:yes stop_codon:yes gene_type:complete